MPAQNARDPIADKLAKKGLGKSLQKHGSDETTYGSRGELPAGVTGVAELVDAKLDVYKKGNYKDEPYVYLAAVVVSPAQSREGVPVAGLRTSQMLRLSDDIGNSEYKKSFDERVAQMLNELRKLGAETDAVKTDQDLKDTLAALVEARPQFRFHTWESKGQGNKTFINHSWDGPTNSAPVAAEGQVEDNTGSGDQSPEPSEEGSEEDWVAIGQAADGGDDEAKTKLNDQLLSQGMTQDEIDAVATWEEAAGLVGGEPSEPADPPEPDEPADEWEPKVSDVYPIKLKGWKKQLEYEVLEVNKNTLKMKQLKGKDVQKNVPWSKDPDTVGNVPV